MALKLKNRVAAEVVFTLKNAVIGAMSLFLARDSDAHPAYRWTLKQQAWEGTSYNRSKFVITIPRYDSATMVAKKSLLVDFSGLVPRDCTIEEIENLRELVKSYIGTVEFSELLLNAQA